MGREQLAEIVTVPINKPYANVIVTLQVFESEEGEMICGLRYIEGQIDLPPKAARQAILSELKIIEGLARDAGCVEMRHAGDDRAKLLPGYEPMNDERLRNGRRKRL